MTHRSVAVVLCAFVVLTVAVFQGCDGGMKTDDARTQDLAALERLLSQDATPELRDLSYVPRTKK